MEKTLHELEKLWLEYRNQGDQNAYVAVRECINIVLESKGE